MLLALLGNDPRSHGTPVSGVQRLVRGADDFADLDVVVQERNEFLPRVLPESDDRPVLCAPLLGQFIQRSPGRKSGGEIGFTSRLRASQSFFDANLNSGPPQEARSGGVS